VGARVVADIIFDLGSKASLAVYVVWIEMLPADNLDEAHRQAGHMLSPWIAHFHDPGKMAGKAIAETLGAEDRVAWDFYLTYRPGDRWGETPPRPQAWTHQLAGAVWANPFRYRTGEALKRELSKMISTCIAKASMRSD